MNKKFLLFFPMKDEVVRKFVANCCQHPVRVLIDKFLERFDKEGNNDYAHKIIDLDEKFAATLLSKGCNIYPIKRRRLVV